MRTEKIVGFRVDRSGREYPVNDVPRTIKDATVTIEVSDEGRVIGTYETDGYANDGVIGYVVKRQLTPVVEETQEVEDDGV